MGRWFSSPAPPAAAPAPVFEKPWRKMDWGSKEDGMKWLKDLHLEDAPIQHLRILLYGPAGSGKSSFINSVGSICQNRMMRSAAASISAQSFTVKYKTYRIQAGLAGPYYPFVFNDMMGLEAVGGAREEDIKLAMKGHVRDGYKFDPESAIDESDQFYNSNPDQSDQVDIVVCVLNASATALSDDVIAKMRNITLAARDCEIPLLAILTRIDEACPHVKKSVKNVYKSKFIKKKMEEYNVKLGIPVGSMFPVKNYHEEIQVGGDIDVLILRALKEIICLANDCANSNH